MSRQPFPLDRAAIRRRFSAAAEEFDHLSVLHRDVARRMVERLDYIKLTPGTILDLGCGTGADLNALGERYPDARRIACDASLSMLTKAGERTAWFRRLLPVFGSRPPQPLCADATALPLARTSTGLIWSNLMLHWLEDPLPAFKEMQRVLQVDGLLMFTSFGPDTLKELREAFGEAEPHVHRFIDMHDIGDMLVTAGFAEPVMDMEVITLTYASSEELLRDLRGSGAANAASGRRRGLMGKAAWKQALAALEARRLDGRLPLTFEIVYGHAWKPRSRVTADGRAVVNFDPKLRGRL